MKVLGIINSYEISSEVQIWIKLMVILRV